MTQVSIDDLIPDPANPRRIDDAELEALTRSIAQFGLVDPIIARREDRRVIGGHQRLLAARRLGLETVPTVLLDVSLEDAQLLNLALNKIAGTWDEELLARLLAGLEQTSSDLSLSGFDENEVAALLRTLDRREKRERLETFDLEAALEQAGKGRARVKRGELWRLGEHRLLCGDATSAADVARLTEDTPARMAFTDPPYNVAYGDHGGRQRGQRKRRIANDAMPPAEWRAFCQGWAGNLVAHVAGALYVCMSTKEWPAVSQVLGEAGAHWSDTIIWAKDRFTLGRAPYQRQYEPLWFGWPDGATPHWFGDRNQGDVWQIPRPAIAELHPTMKPLALVERAIANSSAPNDLVLDLFLGSGSTLIAAERTGRVCAGLELDPHYAAVILARWESFTGESAVRT